MKVIEKLPNGFADADKLLVKLKNEEAENWIRRGENMAFRLFHKMSTAVPAYKDFLQKNKFSPRIVKTTKDIKKIPLIDKDNYLRKYPLKMLSWKSEYPGNQWVFSTTSGSTGKPYYFPRKKLQDKQYAALAEIYLRTNFDIQNKKTLYIVGFPMGAWIGGLFTYEALQIISRSQKYDLSIITPGINKAAIVDAVATLAEDYDQIIVGAYAPFLKDIIDAGIDKGIKWDSLNIGFIFSAEVFSENFRDYLADVTQPANINTFSLNHYGTVDMGTMAYETPLSVAVRRLLVKEGRLNELFPEEKREPTLTQYLPELHYFEEIDANIACSSYSGLPLMRYNLKDYGGVVSFSRIEDAVNSHGFEFEDWTKSRGIDKSVWKLPFVYVYERDDMTVSYYAFLIYPETIRKVLNQTEFQNFLTGKFAMQVSFDDSGKQILTINIEKVAESSIKDTEKSTILNRIHTQLLEDNSEYRHTYELKGNTVKPTIKIWDYADPSFFDSKGKQKWVVK